MKRAAIFLGILLTLLAIAGCQNNLQNAGHCDDCACQRDLARLMHDQPGYVPPVFCDQSFVMHLEANR